MVVGARTAAGVLPGNEPGATWQVHFHQELVARAARSVGAMRLLSCVAIQVVVASAAFQQRLPAALSSSAAAAARPAVHAAANIAAAAAILPSRHAAAQMFAEPPAEPPSDDIFEELSEQLTPMQKRLRGLSPIAMGATTKTVTVLSALIAWFLTPPVGRVASLGSLLAGGYGGSRLSKTMREQRRGVVPAAIADMVKASGLAGLSPKEVAKLQEQYDVDPVEFEAQLSDIYARYLRTLLDADENTPAQIKELGQLRRGMGLRWNATEAAHVESVAAFLDGAALAPNAADELPAELTALLWLSAGLFGTSKGQASTAALEGALSLDEPSSARLVSSLSTPFYRKAVTLAVGKYNSTEAPMVLGTARKALCLSEQAAAKVHAEIYDAQLQVHPTPTTHTQGEHTHTHTHTHTAAATDPFGPAPHRRPLRPHTRAVSCACVCLRLALRLAPPLSPHPEHRPRCARRRCCCPTARPSSTRKPSSSSASSRASCRCEPPRSVDVTSEPLGWPPPDRLPERPRPITRASCPIALGRSRASRSSALGRSRAPPESDHPPIRSPDRISRRCGVLARGCRR